MKWEPFEGYIFKSNKWAMLIPLLDDVTGDHCQLWRLWTDLIKKKGKRIECKYSLLENVHVTLCKRSFKKKSGKKLERFPIPTHQSIQKYQGRISTIWNRLFMIRNSIHNGETLTWPIESKLFKPKYLDKQLRNRPAKEIVWIIKWNI